jgi:uncharacterized surface protein with fasciclin (FAS1) repeats
VFAPTNAAFSKLPVGTVGTLLKPESKETLTKVLTYHVVAGRMSAMVLKNAIKASGGKLWAMMKGHTIMLKDEKGDVVSVTQADVFQSNGVIHVIDAVVLPN